MNIRIKLPMHKRNTQESKLDPFFPVSVMKYMREDGIDDHLRCIVNGDTNKTMGQIGKGYNVVTHRDASGFIHDFLYKVGICFNSERKRTGSAGAKYFETISFPEYAFSPEKNGTSSAVDLANLDVPLSQREVMVPYINIKNSYDKTSAVSWAHGVARLTCLNGMAIFSKDRMFMAYRHNQKIDYDRVKNTLLTGLDKSINIIQLAYNRLNEEKGLDFLRDLIDGDYPDKFRLAVLQKVAPFATIETETIVGDEGKHKTLIIKDIKTEASAWSIYNVATDVASHALTNPIYQDKIGRKVAKTFAIA